MLVAEALTVVPATIVDDADAGVAGKVLATPVPLGPRSHVGVCHTHMRTMQRTGQQDQEEGR